MRHEREDPTAPGAVGFQTRQILCVEVDFPCHHVLDATAPPGRFESIEEPAGPLQGDNPSRRPGDVGQIEGGVPGA